MADTPSSQGGLPEGIAAIEKMLLGEESSAAPANEAAEQTQIPDSGTNPDELLESVSEQATEETTEDSEKAEETPDDKALKAEAEAQEQSKPEKEKGSRAQERIRQLAEEKNLYKEELASLKTQLEAQRKQQDYQVQLAHYQAQLELQKQQAALAEMRATLDQFKSTKEEENLDPVQKFKREVLREAQQQAKALTAEETKALRSQLQVYEEEKKAAKEQAERQKRYSYFDSEADKALKDVVLKEFDSKSASKLHEPMKEVFLAWCAAAGQTPAQAAKQFKEFADGLGAAKMAAVSKKAGATVAKGKTLPPTGTNRSVSQSGSQQAQDDSYKPTKAELRQDGRFSTFLDWAFAGRPQLRK